MKAAFAVHLSLISWYCMPDDPVHLFLGWLIIYFLVEQQDLSYQFTAPWETWTHLKVCNSLTLQNYGLQHDCWVGLTLHSKKKWRDSWIFFYQTFHGPGLGKLFPARASLVSDISAGDRKSLNLYLQCSVWRQWPIMCCFIFVTYHQQLEQSKQISQNIEHCLAIHKNRRIDSHVGYLLIFGINC
jgi:hypothetical protein